MRVDGYINLNLEMGQYLLFAVVLLHNIGRECILVDCKLVDNILVDYILLYCLQVDFLLVQVQNLGYPTR